MEQVSDQERARRWVALVVEVSKMPGVIDGLLADHRDDGHGRCDCPDRPAQSRCECGRDRPRCRTCGSPQRAVATRWPCTLYRLAVQAQSLNESR